MGEEEGRGRGGEKKRGWEGSWWLTTLIKPASHLHFKTGMATNYSQRSTRGPAQHHFFPFFGDIALDMALMVLTQSVKSKY